MSMADEKRQGASLYFPMSSAIPLAVRVLVVERTGEARAAIRESLMRIGLPGDRIAMAEDIPTAIFVYHVFHPNVVISDVEMPSAKGTNLARELQRIDPRLRFIVLSSLPRIHPKLQNLLFNRAFTVMERPVGG